MANHITMAEFIEKVENYCNDKMSATEKNIFEQELKDDKAQYEIFQEYKSIFNWLKLTQKQDKLQQILAKQHAPKSITFLINKQVLRCRYFIFKNKSSIIAASIVSALFLFGLYLTGIVSNHTNQLVELKRNFSTTIKKLEHKIANVDIPQNSKIDNLGTGFLIDNDGFIITSSHVLNGSNNIYVENIDGQSFKTQLVLLDKTIDLALLKIIDDKFIVKENIPFKLSPRNTELGENIFTLGFPKEDIVYSEGYLSSLTGFNSDSLTMQMNLSLNPGNSGGPIFDAYGNVIGVVRNKQKEVDGVSFAIKSAHIINAIQTAKYNDIDKQLKGLQVSKNIPLSQSGNKITKIKKYQKYIYVVKSYS